MRGHWRRWARRRASIRRKFFRVGGAAAAGSMSGTASGSSSTAANIAVAGTLFLAATVAGMSSPAAALSADVYMSGSSAGVSSETGSLELLSELSAFCPSIASGSGDLRGAVRLNAFEPSLASGSGALSLDTKLEGAAAGVTMTTGYLRIGEVLMDGVAAGVASSTATLSLDGVALEGAATAICSASAALSLDVALSAVAAGMAGQSADLGLEASLSATSAGVAAPTGTLTLAGVAMVGAAAGVASETGALSLASKVSGASAGAASEAGALSLAASLVGAGAGVASETADLSRSISLAGTTAGVASQTANLTITAGGFAFVDIDWAAWWDAAGATNDGVGRADTQPNSAIGVDSGGTNADLIYASTHRPLIDLTVAAANNKPGLIAAADSFGETTAGTWWELSSTSDKMILIQIAIVANTTPNVWLRSQLASSRGGPQLSAQLSSSNTAVIDENGGVAAITDIATVTNVPVPGSVPVVIVNEYDGRGGVGILKFISQGVRGPGTTNTLGVISASSPSWMGHLGSGTASKTADGTHLLAGIKRGWLSWLEDAEMLDLLETDYAVTGHHCVHRMAPLMHLTTRQTIVSAELSHWLHLEVGVMAFTSGSSADYPAESTLAGLAAPHFRGNTERNLLESSSLVSVFNTLSEYHIFIVFQSNNQTSAGGTTTYYDASSFLTDVGGLWSIGLTNDGAVVAGFWSATDGDVEVASATGYDDNAVHVVHVKWNSGDAQSLSIQVDADAVVSLAVTDNSTSVTTLRVGANYAGTSELEATFHMWGHGAMTAGEIADFYDALAFRYGVTTP